MSNGENYADDQIYLDILTKKMTKPVKRKRKKKENSIQGEDEEYDEEEPDYQGNIFKVEVDKKAV